MDEVIITTSWDDGHPLDLKLAELLKRYDIPATFYIPIDNIERECMNPRQISEIAQSFDVGGHSYHHMNLTRISPKEAEKEIIEGKKRLEEIIGREVISFCYPRGSFNHDTINMVEGSGFIGARTVKLFHRSINAPFKMGTTAYTNDLNVTAYMKHSVASLDPGLFLFIFRNNLFFKRWERIATETLDFVTKNGGVWHLWGHSWEIDSNNDWEKLERVLCQVSKLPKKALKVDNSQLIRIYTNNKRGG